jgi:hypothetical protein
MRGPQAFAANSLELCRFICFNGFVLLRKELVRFNDINNLQEQRGKVGFLRGDSAYFAEVEDDKLKIGQHRLSLEAF